MDKLKHAYQTQQISLGSYLFARFALLIYPGGRTTWRAIVFLIVGFVVLSLLGDALIEVLR